MRSARRRLTLADDAADDLFDPRFWDCPLPYTTLRLTRGMDCVLDYDDWVWARQWLWQCTWANEANRSVLKWYASRTVRVDGRSVRIWLHKEILKRHVARPSRVHFIGDHVNGDSLDNRLCNLRWATVVENCSNKYGKQYQQRRMAL